MIDPEDLEVGLSFPHQVGEIVLTLPRRIRQGEGFVLADQSVRLLPPPVSAPGTVLRLPGCGHEGTEGVGDLRVSLLVEGAMPSQELRLSPGDARRGTRRWMANGSFFAEVPAGLETGMAVQTSGWHLRVIVDPSLKDDLPSVRPASRGDRWIRGAGLAFALYGFIGAFALPFSSLGEPVVFVDGRFFVLGFLGLAIALVGVEGGPLRGGRKAVALAGAALTLIAIGGATWGLILLLEHFGYFMRFR